MNWISYGTEIESGLIIGDCICTNSQWQLMELMYGGQCVLVVPELLDKWVSMHYISRSVFKQINLECGERYYCVGMDDVSVASVEYGPFPGSYTDALAFAISMKQTREIAGDVSFGDAVYLESVSRLLPSFSGCKETDAEVLGTWLSMGVHISTDSFERLASFCSWMHPAGLQEIISEAGLAVNDGIVKSLTNEKTRDYDEMPVSKDSIEIRKFPDKENKFILPGRPDLERFFNEQIIDVILNNDKYRIMGIDFPGAVILHGPPGCGKTFAVERLIDYLGFPSYYINSGSIGSSYIHDTSKKISFLFETAINHAPSVVVIDEMEAFLSDRNSDYSGTHHVEEVAEFLRIIPKAIENHVLIFAMTNLIDSIDPAILRKGRFDHIIEVSMPSKDELVPLLQKMYEKLPTENIDYYGLADKLSGHSMADVSFVVKESGMISVRNNKQYIGNNEIMEAIKALPAVKEKKNRIGFCSDED